MGLHAAELEQQWPQIQQLPAASCSVPVAMCMLSEAVSGTSVTSPEQALTPTLPDGARHTHPGPVSPTLFSGTFTTGMGWTQGGA